MSREPRILSASAPAQPSDDSAADMVASTLTAIESQLGEAQGWDLPPRLFALRLQPPGVMVDFIPEALWNPSGINPADALGHHAATLPPVPPLLVPGVVHEDSVFAVGFMFEGWSKPKNVELPRELRTLRNSGERVLHLLPGRQEIRIVQAVDLNQRAFHMVRVRGGQPRLSVAGRKDALETEGTIPDALSRFVHAFRTGLAQQAKYPAPAPQM
ncbi:hypothetical protein HET69_41510 [Streptomyces sp. CJ_13]|uniref:hypothetical protein n=1 Tax=Streptomyces sp. CJ_13 TaxID=2724943 RepID=UPI001BDD04C9|nr:hypothetical protein [Streptomyces sp. CJ_13]MBT1190278.1 hypothetical protein [Streptomyces sp. CJ_13]